MQRMPVERTSGEPTIDIGRALRRQLAVIVICTVGAGLVTAGWLAVRTPSYSARSTVLLVALAGESSPGGGRERSLDVDTQVAVARSTALLTTVADELGVSLGAMRSKSKASAAPTGDVVYFDFVDPNRDRAIAGSATYAEAFIAHRTEEGLAAISEDREALESQRLSLQQKVDDLSSAIETESDRGEFASSTTIAALEQEREIAIVDLADVENDLAALPSTVNAGRVLVEASTAVHVAGLGDSVVLGGALLLGALAGIVFGLLRDRRDRRYGTFATVHPFGIDELARIEFPSPTGSKRSRGAPDRNYTRLLARLGCGFAEREGPVEARSALVVAVEGTTHTAELAAEVVRRLAAQATSLGLRVRSGYARDVLAVATPPDQDFRSTIDSRINDIDDTDVVLLWADPLDVDSTALAVAASVDRVAMLVSAHTDLDAVLSSLDDLRAVGARAIGVVDVDRSRGHNRTRA